MKAIKGTSINFNFKIVLVSSSCLTSTLFFQCLLLSMLFSYMLLIVHINFIFLVLFLPITVFSSLFCNSCKNLTICIYQLVPAVTELIVAELMYLQWMDPKEPIYLYINSTGTTRDDGETVSFTLSYTM